MISPETPQEVREALLGSSGNRPIPNTVAFLYIDEKYLDTQAPPEMQVTSLTGLLVSAETYPLLRDRLSRFYPVSMKGLETSKSRSTQATFFETGPTKSILSSIVG